jgi:hypothetical protein
MSNTDCQDQRKVIGKGCNRSSRYKTNISNLAMNTGWIIYITKREDDRMLLLQVRKIACCQTVTHRPAVKRSNDWAAHDPQTKAVNGPGRPDPARQAVLPIP